MRWILPTAPARPGAMAMNLEAALLHPKARDERGRYAVAVGVLNDAELAAEFARTCNALAAAAHLDGRILSERTTLEQVRRAGILAGSFNPLTRAHVALGNTAKAAGQLDVIVWTLTVVTVDKERVDRASLVDRLLQMRAFVEASSNALALINRGLYVEQAGVARQLFPRLEELYIVIGFDKIRQILDPRYYDDRNAALDRLFDAASLLVAPRADDDEASLRALINRRENRRYRERIAFCPLPRRFREASSSASRALAGAPGSARQLRMLLPPEGRALALATGAYTGEAHDDGQQQRGGDSYSVRQALIAWLASLDAERSADAPPLDVLLAARLDPLNVSDEVATWLARAGQFSGIKGSAS